jgi:hypothetical protein
MDKRIRDLLVRAEEEMIFVGPDHPSYDLLAGLVAAVREAWQEGYEHARRGGAGDNPYRG